MKKYITKQSSIKGAGKGLFTNTSFKKGELIGLAHVNGQPTKEVGSNHNHNEKNPTANNIKNGNKRYLIASKNLKPGEEITTNYRMQPELEQPEDFKKKKGGSMTPQKDGYRTYSPFKNLPYIDVESDTIDSDDIVYDLKLKANNGLTKFIKKNTGLHTLPGAKVIREIPVKRKGGALLTKEVTCKKCGWEWNAADGGKDITTCHKCNGQGLVHAQNGGDTESNGETYKYLGRPDSLYKKSLNGRWLISNKSTGNKFVSIEDPKGSRTKELDKNAVTVSSLNKKRRDHLSKLKKEMDFPKEFINLKDTRKIRATTGEKINPNVDLKADKYNKAIIDNIIKKAKAVGVDPSTMLAIALQETNFGKTDSNLGHVKKGYKGYPYSYIDFYKQKLNEAKFKDELLQIQYYNGLGTVYPETEEDYHGYEMQKIYGVPLPASGINMRKNPLYGKQIIDLRDNVILKNPYIQKALKQKQKGGDNTDAMTGMMKVRLAYANEFGNPAAERMINLPDNPYQFDNGDTGSHYMASYDNYAVPQIQDENGVLQLGDYGPESNEAIRFDSDEDANYFAENYKNVSPGFLNEKQYGGISNDYIEADLDEDEIEEYRRGGYIVEEIDNYQDGGVYTVKGSDGVYKKVNGKWQVDWNKSGKYQPLSKGDIKARTAVLNKMAKPLYDKDYDEMVAYKNLSTKDKINKFEPKKEATKEELKIISERLGRDYKPLSLATGSVNMVYPEKYVIGPSGGMIGGLLKNPYVTGAANAYFGAEGIKEWVDSDSDLRKSIGKAWNNPTGNNIGDFGYELGINALNFSGLPFGKYYKNYKNIGKTPIQKKYSSFKPRKPKTINLNQNPGWLQLPKVNSKSYFEYKKLKYQNGGHVDVDLTPEEIKDLIAQGYVIEELN